MTRPPYQDVKGNTFLLSGLLADHLFNKAIVADATIPALCLGREGFLTEGAIHSANRFDFIKSENPL